MKEMFCKLFLFLTVNGANAQELHWKGIVLEGDEWSYRVPSGQVSTDWITPDYDDAGWQTGQSGFGYGDYDDATILAQGTLVVQLRKKFTVTELDLMTDLRFVMDYDDGYVAYLNGVEIGRDLVQGDPPAHNQAANGLHEAQLYQGMQPVYVTVDKALLRSGENVLAISVHNDNVNSSDLTAIPHLMAAFQDNVTGYRDVPSWFRVATPFIQSLLPIVHINTSGASIVDDPKVRARIGIIYNGDGNVNHVNDRHNEYSGWCGIEIRGESSQSFPKKSYGFELWDEAGNDMDSSFLGFPKEEDFILYGPYSDKTLINNRLAMALANRLGHYASRTRFVELIINGQHEGIYVLMERIKRDPNRVNIANLRPSEISGDDLTGGYIIRLDKGSYDGWYSRYDVFTGWGKLYFQYYFPDQRDIVPQQKTYIKQYFDDFEEALYSVTYRNSKGKHYSDYINVLSFVDHFIISELSKNVDAYRLSSYFYKDKDSRGGKLTCGYWDFNLSFGNADYCFGDQTSGWMYYQCDHGPNPFWWDRLLKDERFVNTLNCRWTELREGTLHNDNIFALIDGFVAEATPTIDQNFARWPVLGQYVWPNPWFYANADNYQLVISRMKDWIQARTRWMDQNMPGTSNRCEDYLLSAYNQAEINIYPNPASSVLTIATNEQIEEVILMNVSGQTVRKAVPNAFYFETHIHDLSQGIYIVRVKTASRIISRQIVITP